MKTMYLIFSHSLSEEQKQEAIEKYGVKEFKYLPNKLQFLWSNISPYQESVEEDIRMILCYIEKNACKEDIILVQGDYGSTYYLVSRLIQKGYICIYSTSHRVSSEENIGKTVIKTSKFSHIRFRRYI